MSALVLGKRSTSCFFEELHHHPPTGAAATPPPPPTSSSFSKRPRFGASPSPLFYPPQPSISSSPTGAFPPPHGAAGANSDCCGSSDQAAPLFHLRSLFPGIDEQLLEKVLEASGNDLDSAIRSLKERQLESSDGGLQSAGNLGNTSGIGVSENPSVMNSLPADGSDWVELFVREMINATNVDVARVHASRLLEVLEKSIMTQISAEMVQAFHKENLMLKEQVKELLHDNNILKRAVAIQHDRRKEFDERNQELQHLKELVAKYQEHVRALEVNNYALSMHLRQAQEGANIPGRFHPDVF